jgi:hypothetical protein
VPLRRPYYPQAIALLPRRRSHSLVLPDRCIRICACNAIGRAVAPSLAAVLVLRARVAITAEERAAPPHPEEFVPEFAHSFDQQGADGRHHSTLAVRGFRLRKEKAPSVVPKCGKLLASPLVCGHELFISIYIETKSPVNFCQMPEALVTLVSNFLGRQHSGDARSATCGGFVRSCAVQLLLRKPRCRTSHLAAEASRAYRVYD